MKNYIENLKRLLPSLFIGIPDTDGLNEIRLRPEKCPYFIYSDKRLVHGAVVDRKRFDAVLLALCGGNLYKHESTLPSGFFNDILGGRCGIGCSVSYIENNIRVAEITSLNIRVPRFIIGVGKELFEYWEGQGFSGGIIIFGLPGAGKTTYIRSFAGLLCECALNVCVVDERREFSSGDYSERANIDILSGYKKWHGIEIALRTMSADVIICDEMGLSDRDEQLADLALSGVPLIATAHASSRDQLMKKSWFVNAVYSNVFTHYAHIENKKCKEIGKLCS